MANRIVISICGEEYTLVADEVPAYMQKVGNYVSEKMTDVMEAAKVGDRVKVWVVEVDEKKKRIALSMIPPVQK